MIGNSKWGSSFPFKKSIHLILMLTVLLVLGCAKPNYASEVLLNNEHGGGGPNNQSQSVVDCTFKFKLSTVCLSWQWEKKPTSNQMGSLILKSYRPNHYDSTPVVVNLEQVPFVLLWMPGMGHGSSPTHTSVLDVGTYRVSDVFFIMPGEWEIKVQLKDTQGKIEDEVVIPLMVD